MIKKTRLVIFTSYFWPHLGGVETYTLQLSKLLNQKGFLVSIITCNTEKARSTELFDGVKLYRLDCWHLLGQTLPVPKLNSRNLLLIKKCFATIPNLIMTETRFAPISLWGSYLSRIKHIAALHIEHGSEHITGKNRFINFAFHFYDHFFGTWIIRNAKINIAISSQGLILLRHLGAKSTELIYNSLLIKDFNRKKADQADHHIKNITYVGRMIEQKGVHNLVKAFQTIDSKEKRLVLIGDGNYLPALRKLANQDPSIVFTGQLKIDKVKEALRQTTIFVNPSFLESLPTSVLEAGVLGLPIIATNVGGTKDIIKNNVNGILVEPHQVEILADKMTLLLKNQKLRNKFSQEITQTIKEDFNWAKNIKKIIEAINQCL